MKKNFFLCLVLFLFAGSLFAQQGWVDVSNSQSNGSLRKIYFFSDSLFLVTSNSNYYLTSTNMGNSWNKVILNFDAAAFAEYEVSAPGIIYALKSGTIWKILKSTNDGITFDTINSTPSINSYFWSQLNFINSLTGFVSRYPSTSGISSLMRTSNGGITWDTTQTFYISGGPTFFETAYFTNYSINPLPIGYAVHYRTTSPPSNAWTYLRKTTNSGLNWQQVTPPSSPYGGIVYSDSSYVYFPLSNKLLRYRDNLSLIDTIDKRSGTYYFKNRKDGFVYSFTSFMFTKDSCHSWYQLPYINSLTSIKFFNNNIGFALTSNGKIYKTVNGGVSIGQLSSIALDNFSLSQNYPNPFNPSTKINYEINSSGFVSLKVFDLLGKEVALLINEKQNSGSYSINFNSSQFNLPSGIYFYTLIAEEFKETRKMVLIK